MASTGKYWREAASLIIAAKAPRAALRSTNHQPELSLLANHRTNLSNRPQRVDYNILMVTRSNSSSIHANRCVFPGGLASTADFDPGWNELFIKVTGRSLTEVEAEFAVRGPQPPAYNETQLRGIPPTVGFRISAIRETFEESGVALLTSSPGYHGNNDVTIPTATNHKDLERWRTLVSEDPNQLLALCRYLSAVPNVWALYEWSNWLTPAYMTGHPSYRQPTRFDTLFYVTCLREQPNCWPCEKETTSAQWMCPETWLHRGYVGHVRLLTPQIQQLLQVAASPNLKDLHAFIRQREPIGLTRLETVMILCEDGVIFVAREDELYPDDPDMHGVQPILSMKLTLEQVALQHPREKRLYVGTNIKWDLRGWVCHSNGFPVQNISKQIRNIANSTL